jgi:aldehyde:ferredoxin oxidoreductase
LSWDRKAEYCKKYEDLCSFSNSLVLCAFNSSERISSSNGYFAFRTILELANALTGLEIGYDDMLRIGERNYAIRRLIAAADGYRMAGSQATTKKRAMRRRGNPRRDPRRGDQDLLRIEGVR